MMKSITLFVTLLLISKITFSQDTTYLDYNMRPVSVENARYTRVVVKTDTGYVQHLWNSSENLRSVEVYSDSKLKTQEGFARYYYENGVVSREGKYKNTNRSGIWRHYHENGNLAALVNFDKTDDSDNKYYKSNGEIETDQAMINRLPSYPGGMEAMNKYIASSIRYNKKGVKGTVKVAFTISRSGKVVEVQTQSGVNEELDAEAVRVIQEMPDWIPGIQYNVLVGVRYILPIAFK